MMKTIAGCGGGLGAGGRGHRPGPWGRLPEASGCPRSLVMRCLREARGDGGLRGALRGWLAAQGDGPPPGAKSPAVDPFQPRWAVFDDVLWLERAQYEHDSGACRSTPCLARSSGRGLRRHRWLRAHPSVRRGNKYWYRMSATTRRFQVGTRPLLARRRRVHRSSTHRADGSAGVQARMIDPVGQGPCSATTPPAPVSPW